MVKWRIRIPKMIEQLSSVEVIHRDILVARFVRIGTNIFFSLDMEDTHKIIAERCGVIEEKKINNRFYLVVDDGGWLKLDDGRLKFDNSTSSVFVRGDKNQARIDTIEQGKQLCGEENISINYDLF